MNPPRLASASAPALVTAALGLLLAPLASARADERRDRIVAAFDKARACVVSLRWHPKLTGPPEAVALAGEQERERTADAVLVERGGLLVAVGSQVEPGEAPVTRGGVTLDRPDRYRVKLPSGKEAHARFVGRDEDTNLALLQLEEDARVHLGDLPYLDAAGAAKPELAGEVLVVALMSAEFGYAPRFLLTRVNAHLEKPWPLLGTETPVGDYVGGAAVTLEGAFVGFVGLRPPAPAPAPGTREGAGAAAGRGSRPAPPPRVSPLPTLYPASVVADLVKHPPQAKKAWLGLHQPALQALTRELAEALGVGGRKGVLVGEVLDGSPAERGGLRDGDLLVRFDGKDLDVDEDRDLPRFLRLIKRAGPGKEVQLVVLRRGAEGKYAESTHVVTLEEVPPGEQEVQERDEKDFGLKYKELTRDVLLNLKLDYRTTGVRVTGVERAGWASLAHVQAGDIIRKVDDQDVSDVASFQALLAKARAEKRPSVVLFVLRGTKTEFLNVHTEFK
ncbi:MAG: PDZ domain-containing protein [Planctomycetes bacterium]|nr:PDZ domain-containing protein [Planctomycetota bacterium]